MSGLFINFNEYIDLDISKWDTSKVTDMHSMFFSAQNFNANISGWNVSKTTTHDGFDIASGLSSSHLPSFP